VIEAPRRHRKKLFHYVEGRDIISGARYYLSIWDNVTDPAIILLTLRYCRTSRIDSEREIFRIFCILILPLPCLKKLKAVYNVDWQSHSHVLGLYAVFSILHGYNV